jgi:hypothetical protein
LVHKNARTTQGHFLEDTVARQWPGITLEEWPNAAVALGHSATTSYVMWLEERLWNVILCLYAPLCYCGEHICISSLIMYTVCFRTMWKKCCFSGDGEYICAGSARQHALYVWEKSIGNLVKILHGTKGELLLDVVVSIDHK